MRIYLANVQDPMNAHINQVLPNVWDKLNNMHNDVRAGFEEVRTTCLRPDHLRQFTHHMLSSVNSFTFSAPAGSNNTEQAIVVAGSNVRTVVDADKQEQSDDGGGGTAIVPTYKLFWGHRTVTGV